MTHAGWRVLGQRVRTPEGEVDLVVARGRELLCVEVKTAQRPGRFEPGKRFRPDDLRRQRRAARCIARTLGWPGTPEVALFEVWLEGPLGARGRLRSVRGRRASWSTQD